MTSEDRDIEVDVPDSNLRASLELILDKAPGERITRADMATIVGLAAPGMGIVDLTGLEFAASLDNLNLSDNLISDLSPVSQLFILWSQIGGARYRDEIHLRNNLIEDLSPLDDTPIYLVTLDLSGNAISNLGTMLRGEIRNLVLSDNTVSTVSDFSPLADLFAYRLDLSGNSISDLALISELLARPAPIANRTRALDVSDNQIRDLSPLSGAHLHELNLARNPLCQHD